MLTGEPNILAGQVSLFLSVIFDILETLYF
jgi:hypothetical protein